MEEPSHLSCSEAPATFHLDRNDAGVPFWLLDGWPESEPILHVQGSWPPPRRVLAIVGSTTPSPLARSWAFSLARIAASRGWAIVSGLARGIDAAAHEGALAANGQTIAVLGSGLGTIYPPEHDDLTTRILAHGGARLSFAAEEEPASRDRLLQRNALTSALSVAVVAVQSRGRDGTLATMRYAALQQRALAACRPPIDDDSGWQGNELLLAESSPWRLPAVRWSAAHPIDPSDDEGYLAWLDALLDSLSASRETALMTDSRQ